MYTIKNTTIPIKIANLRKKILNKLTFTVKLYNS